MAPVGIWAGFVEEASFQMGREIVGDREEQQQRQVCVVEHLGKGQGTRM